MRRSNKNQRLALALLAVPLAVSAAPPPPPGSEISSGLGRQQAREAMQQVRRFETAGLPIPAVPANGGQCVIDISGQYAPAAGQRGASGTYRLYEIQRWVVSPSPTTAGQNPLRYSVQWTTVGNGERHEDNGVGTRNDWSFAISGGANTQLTATRIASSGNWLVQRAPVSAPNGVTVTQQPSVVGMPPQTPVTVSQAANAFAYPATTAAAAAGSPVQITEGKTFRVPQDTNWGYPRPAYATGTIACTWTLTVGP